MIQAGRMSLMNGAVRAAAHGVEWRKAAGQEE